MTDQCPIHRLTGLAAARSPRVRAGSRSCAVPTWDAPDATPRCAPLSSGAIWCGQLAGRELPSARPASPCAADLRSHVCTVCRRHPIAASHIGHGSRSSLSTLSTAPYRESHESQLHQHGSRLPRRGRDSPTAKEHETDAKRGCSTVVEEAGQRRRSHRNGCPETVVHLPEPMCRPPTGASQAQLLTLVDFSRTPTVRWARRRNDARP